MSARSKKFAGIGLLGCGLVLAYLLFGWPSERAAFVLDDGLRVVVADVKVGYTNEFREGSKVEQWLGNRIATNGWQFFGRSILRRPVIHHFYRSTNATLLSMQFRVFGETNAIASSALFGSPRLREFRIRHWGDPAYRFVEEPRDLFFSPGRGDPVGYFITGTFDRTSKKLNFELQQFDYESRRWESRGVISMPNPDRRELFDWAPFPCPATNRIGNLEVVLGTVEVLIQKTESGGDDEPWDNAVRMALRLYENGEITRQFEVHELGIFDASGNFSYLRGKRFETNGWNVYQGWRSVLPNVPWKIVGRCARVGNFSAAELHHVQVRLRSQLVTNLGGLKTTIQFVGPNMMLYGLALEDAGKRIILADALNEAGESVKGQGGSVAQHFFLKEIDYSRVSSNLFLKIAVVSDTRFEFTVKPTMLDQWPPLGH